MNLLNSDQREALQIIFQFYSDQQYNNTSPSNWITFESLMHNRPHMTLAEFQKCSIVFEIEFEPEIETEMFFTAGTKDENKIDY